MNNPQPQKDPAIATILELFPGFMGIPGLGWIYADRLDVGLTTLAIHWGIIFLGFFIFIVGGTFFTFVTFGLGILLMPCLLLVFFPLPFLVPIISAINVNSYLRTQNVRIRWPGHPQSYYVPPAPSAPYQSASPDKDSQYAPPNLRTEQERRDFVFGKNQPVPVVVQKSGFSSGQVLIIVALSIVAFVVCSCVGLSVIVALGQPPG